MGIDFEPKSQAVPQHALLPTMRAGVAVGLCTAIINRLVLIEFNFAKEVGSMKLISSLLFPLDVASVTKK